MEEYMSSLLTAVLPSVLNKFRIYLSLLRLLDYSISDEVTKAVEEDFVEMRKNDPESITADDLHKTLLVARWVLLLVLPVSVLPRKLLFAAGCSACSWI
ncbi:mini-chromosome maintenance complex-binding protein-like [Neopelma chrysocephalum]|uniref:mini-chromosome maintenance complex-binding protein-like n=1 Tax=Neopelma chrysocephalum TaxID=114329 RepID=UPI000FCD09E8|nr:mini-chromosome maintenance complex-binding protein-like [Neopelma chrysocephalum]XP_027562643.1 mini-chromosome maintenance complex-binding protein-like [Neopelma chrysocephalum]